MWVLASLGRPPLAVGSVPIYNWLMVKLRHYDNEGTARFVTFNCYRNMPALDSELAKSTFLTYLIEARKKHNFRIYGYVVMPNHVHLVLHPPEGMKLGLVIGQIKSKVARHLLSDVKVPDGARRVFWQKRCYDHNCRSPESVIEKINYCHTNPVRSGLVEVPGQWKWSSYNWYIGEADAKIELDAIESGK